MRRAVLSAILAAAIVAVSAPVARAEVPYVDVPRGHWARVAVADVAVANDWLRVPGDHFRPKRLITRRVVARALVRAFAPDGMANETLTFPDLPAEDHWFRFANVAVSLGWMDAADDGSFGPLEPVSKRALDRALVYAIGARGAARALNRISTEDGHAFAVPPGFGATVIADQLHLHYNHPTGPDEALELYPAQAVTRADAAYAISQAARAPGSWMMSSLAHYLDIVLPAMTPARVQAVEFAFRYAGYPYVYAGEWHRETPDAYCCGQQLHGGFDCSGFTWWALAAPTSGWDNTHIRPYAGWTLPQRSSTDMAKATTSPKTLEQMKPLDVALFDTDGSGKGPAHVDHAGVYLGNGWMIHSSGSRAGVTIDLISEGWWTGAFELGRRIVPKTV